MTNSFILSGATIIAEDHTYTNRALYIEDGKIANILPQSDDNATHTHHEITLPDDAFIIPGFIDLHIHGANGSDMMDATPDALYNIAKTIAKEGTTSFLATTITQSPEQIQAALQNVASTVQNEKLITGAKLLGVHLEGPFISAPRAGAQPIHYITNPSIEQFNNWYTASNELIHLVTYAPEKENGLAFTRHLKELGVIPSIGHSDAVYTEVKDAIDAGACHITHLYNGMRGFHHREPGVAGTALSSSELFVELIVDGIHVHPDVVKTTLAAKGADKIILITDSMRAKWLEEGTYDLGGQTVHYQNGQALLENGSLAGSVLKMNEAVKNMVHFSGCSLEEVSVMASANPAKQLGLFDSKGSIRNGKDADLTVLSHDFEILLTISEGRIVYDKRGVAHENH